MLCYIGQFTWEDQKTSRENNIQGKLVLLKIYNSQFQKTIKNVWQSYYISYLLPFIFHNLYSKKCSPFFIPSSFPKDDQTTKITENLIYVKPDLQKQWGKRYLPMLVYILTSFSPDIIAALPPTKLNPLRQIARPMPPFSFMQ